MLCGSNLLLTAALGLSPQNAPISYRHVAHIAILALLLISPYYNERNYNESLSIYGNMIIVYIYFPQLVVIW